MIIHCLVNVLSLSSIILPLLSLIIIIHYYPLFSHYFVSLFRHLTSSPTKKTALAHLLGPRYLAPFILGGPTGTLVYPDSDYRCRANVLIYSRHVVTYIVISLY